MMLWYYIIDLLFKFLYKWHENRKCTIFEVAPKIEYNYSACQPLPRCSSIEAGWDWEHTWIGSNSWWEFCSWVFAAQLNYSANLCSQINLVLYQKLNSALLNHDTRSTTRLKQNYFHKAYQYTFAIKLISFRMNMKLKSGL